MEDAKILDVDMRPALRAWIKEQGWYDGTRIVDEKELNSGSARIDMLVPIVPKMRGFEIKSDGDVIGGRIYAQTAEFMAAVHSFYIVTTRKHWDSLAKKVAAKARCGQILIGNEGDKLTVIQVIEPRENLYLAPRQMANSLWKLEILEVMKDRGITPVGAYKKSKTWLAVWLGDNVTLPEMMKVLSISMAERTQFLNGQPVDAQEAHSPQVSP